jgi:hypothetical protein
MTFYVFGRITYTDVFKIHHWTTFCVRLDVKDTLGFIPCDAYNDAN